MRRLAALFLAVSVPAHADTLVDNVEGITLDAHGRVQRFAALSIDDNGRVEQLFQRGDKRPGRPDYRLDGKGRVLMPGLIDSHLDLMAFGLSLLGPSAPGARPRPDDRDAALLKAQQVLLERGVTAVADMGATIEAWQTYRRAGDLGRLSLRIAAYAASVEDMVLIGGPEPTPWLYDDKLRLNGLHIVYTPPTSTAVSTRPQTPVRVSLDRQYAIQVKNLLSRAGIDGFQAAVSVADPATLTGLLESIAELSRTYTGERRWRIAIPSPADAGVMARFPPGGFALTVVPRAGQSIPSLSHWTAVDLRFAIGSGAPMGKVEPFALIAESFSREDSLAAATSGAAWAAFAEGRFGRIAVGQRADFLLVDRDPLLASPADLRAIRVLETWVGGKPVWRPKDSASANTGPAATAPERRAPESTVSGGR